MDFLHVNILCRFVASFGFKISVELSFAFCVNIHEYSFSLSVFSYSLYIGNTKWSIIAPVFQYIWKQAYFPKCLLLKTVSSQWGSENFCEKKETHREIHSSYLAAIDMQLSVEEITVVVLVFFVFFTVR